MERAARPLDDHRAPISIARCWRRVDAARDATREAPALLAESRQGGVVEGKATAACQARSGRRGHVNWQRSSGELKLAALATSGKEMPRLDGGQRHARHSRAAARELRLDGGELDDSPVTGARLDWPRNGRRELHAALAG